MVKQKIKNKMNGLDPNLLSITLTIANLNILIKRQSLPEWIENFCLKKFPIYREKDTL
jgi:hypothetical protein